MYVEDVITVEHVLVQMTGGVSAAVTLHGQDPIVKVNKSLFNNIFRVGQYNPFSELHYNIS